MLNPVDSRLVASEVLEAHTIAMGEAVATIVVVAVSLVVVAVHLAVGPKPMARVVRRATAVVPVVQAKLVPVP